MAFFSRLCGVLGMVAVAAGLLGVAASATPASAGDCATCVTPKSVAVPTTGVPVNGTKVLGQDGDYDVVGVFKNSKLVDAYFRHNTTGKLIFGQTVPASPSRLEARVCRCIGLKKCITLPIIGQRCICLGLTVC